MHAMTEHEAGLRVSLHQAAPIPLAVELTCGPGEVLALVGPSGSGKSTVLRCIAGLHTPTEGRITCNGETWLDTRARQATPTAARRIGMVFQNYALFPHLSALANVREALPDRRAANAQDRAALLLAKVNLQGLEHRRPHQLSGGQQQRVAVARALAREPRALLLDEPFSAVDRATREKLYGELAELRRELAMPVILVTHDLEEAVMLADRMTLLSQGRSLQSGPPLTLMREPESLDVARLVGLRNLLEVRVEAHEPDHTRLRWGAIALRVKRQMNVAKGAVTTACLPAEGVLLLAARAEREADEAHLPDGLDNPVRGIVRRYLSLGDRVRMTLEVPDAAGALLAMTLPRHLADRLSPTEGSAIALRLRGAAIHVIPAAREG
jgi:molybdate transport system ATP-binding protein